MHVFGSLYRYECKKIWDRKLVKCAFVLCLALVALMGTIQLFGRYVIDGVDIGSRYTEIRRDQAYARALNGRPIDQTLLEEMTEAYHKVPVSRDRHYTGTPEYQKYARPYNEVFQFTLANTKLAPLDIFEGWEPSEQMLYAQRQTRLEELWRELGLSAGEIEFWRAREQRIEKPIVFQEMEAYNKMLEGLQTIGFLVILFVSVSLSGVFPEEHSRRTDQLILSSPQGKRTLYWAKLAAGLSFAVGVTLVFFVVMAVLTFVLYGGAGFQAAFQLHYRSNSDPINCGQAVLIAYANMLFAAVLVSVCVMLFSELFRSSMTAMAISTGLLVASMVVSIPESHRVLGQLWYWLPWCFLSPGDIFGKYTIPLFGAHLTPWQAVPILYALLSAGAAWVGRTVYQRYQVSGR